MAKKRKSKSFYTKDVVLVMIASFMFMFSTMYINPLINGYAKEMGAGGGFAGFIVGFMSVVAMFLRPIAGHMSDRFSKYSLGFLSAVFLLAGAIGYLFAPSAGWLLPFRALTGVGQVLATVSMTTWLSFLVPRQHVGEAMGFYGLMNALAMALAPACSINLYHLLGYRHTLVVSAIAALAMLIIVQFVGDRAEPQPTPDDLKPKHFEIIQPNVLPVAILTTLFSIPYFTTQADIVTYVEQRHLPVAVGFYFMIYAVVLLIVRVSLKNYFDTVRFGVWFWIAVVAMFFYLLMLANMYNNWIMALAAAGMALGYGLIYSVLQSTAMLLAPMSQQGLASATFFLGLDIGMLSGPMIGGWIDETLPVKYFYYPELILIPLILIVYAIWHKRLNGAIYHH